jgi:hypothetical protein
MTRLQEEPTALEGTKVAVFKLAVCVLPVQAVGGGRRGRGEHDQEEDDEEKFVLWHDALTRRPSTS